MSDRVKLTPAQRAAAVERIGESIALRSGAGCGKTFVLARRFTELLLAARDEAPMSRIVALTFTEKAALEMSQRVRRMLSDLAGQRRSADRRRLLQWVEELPEARISTIHSFCAGLLRSHAVEAGVDPSFTVCADELLQGSLIDESVEQAVLAAVEARRADAASLLAEVPFDRLCEQVRRLVEGRAGCDPGDYTDPAETLRRWGESLSAAKRAAQERLAGDERLKQRIEDLLAAPCSDADDRLGLYRDEQLGILQVLVHEPDSWSAGTFARLNAKPGNVGRAAAWGGREQVMEVRRGTKDLVAEFQELAPCAAGPTELDEKAAAALATLATLAAEAERLYAARKRTRGMLDFEDLLVLTNRLLAGNARVRKALSDGIDQLLIDECQDINAFQVELLGRLIFAAPGAGPPPPGRLFIVGDAKQSIYRFRGAQVEVFQDLCRRFGADRQESLDLSFRTHAGGAAFVNHLFAPLMGETYAPIRARRRDCPPRPSVEILIADTPDSGAPGSAAEATAAQAAATAERIAEMVHSREQIVWDGDASTWRPAEYRDIAVLFARMTESPAYERALARRDVPYYVLAGTGFFRRQEVYDVLNALAVIDNPFDDIALFGTLRSGLFGLDDNALMHIAEAMEPPYLPHLMKRPAARMLPGMDAPQARALAFAVELLAALHASKDAVGIDHIIERLLVATGGEAVLLSQFQGRRMLGNVRLLLEQARSAAADGLALADFIAQMEEMVIRESRYEQAAVSCETEDVVRLMTVHRAKGMEFPVVVLGDLNFSRRGRTGDILNRSDWGLTYRLAGDGDGDDLPASFQTARNMERADQAREDVRRLYVAVTRHEDHLVLVGANHRDAEGRFLASDSCLRQLDDVLDITGALEGGRSEIPYGRGRFAAAVRVVAARPVRGGRPASRGRKVLDSAGSALQLADAIMRQGPATATPPRVGPLPAGIGRVELAVTALSEFAYCPMLYHWRHDLRVPLGAAPTAPGGGIGSAPLDAATVGTLLHRCMERLDFRHPQAPAALVQRALAEMDLAEVADAAAPAAELEGMLTTFRNEALWSELADARRSFRELDFVLDLPGRQAGAGAATLRGQIDMLYEDAGGAWHVIDYKSDRIGSEGLAAHVSRYELQMLAYAAAAARFLDSPPADAALYFLRSGETHRFNVTGAVLDDLAERIADLSAELIVSRRSGAFRRAEPDACEVCPYNVLCR